MPNGRHRQSRRTVRAENPARLVSAAESLNLGDTLQPAKSPAHKKTAQLHQFIWQVNVAEGRDESEEG
jgi:hypothetical protein